MLDGSREMAGCHCLGSLALVSPFLLNLGRRGVLKNYSVLCPKKMPQEVPSPYTERNTTQGLACDPDRPGGGLWAGVAGGGENSQAWKPGDLGSCFSSMSVMLCNLGPIHPPLALFQSTQQTRRLDHIKSRSSLAFHQTLDLAASLVSVSPSLRRAFWL